MKKIITALLLITTLTVFASDHETQHGFIISDDDKNFEHLVAQGHHSHQVSMFGELVIALPEEKELYLKNKKANEATRNSYFLFQAQKLNLPAIQSGQILYGHIIQSEVGNYTPKNIIVHEAWIKINKIHTNVKNPFFTEQH